MRNPREVMEKVRSKMKASILKKRERKKKTGGKVGDRRTKGKEKDYLYSHFLLFFPFFPA